MKNAARLTKKVLSRRRAHQLIKKIRLVRGPLAENKFVIGVYFNDSHVNIYQIRQWYAPLQELNKRWPVLIIARNSEGAEALIRESGLEVVFVPKVIDLDLLIQTQPLKIMLYVNQNTENFQMLRYGRRWHVFINHGESDKMYMTTNQIKAYDFAFIAGQAARERLQTHVWAYDVESRTFEIGRPQADFMGGVAPYPNDARTVVLYAPTWEGDRPAASYGSIATHGESIARAILESPEHRLVYRPHPRSGVVDEAYGAAHQKIVALIAEANKSDPGAEHVFDESSAINWQLSQPDVAICDISAMIYDRLAVGKPVMVCRPHDSAALIDKHGYLQACEWVTATSARRVVEEVQRVLNDSSTQEKLTFWASRYFGDVEQGAQMRRFEEAIEVLLSRWDEADNATQRRLDA